MRVSGWLGWAGLIAMVVGLVSNTPVGGVLFFVGFGVALVGPVAYMGSSKSSKTWPRFKKVIGDALDALNDE